jgi:hypothetical protein
MILVVQSYIAYAQHLVQFIKSVFLCKPRATPVKLRHVSQNTGMSIRNGLILSEDHGVRQKTVHYSG